MIKIQLSILVGEFIFNVGLYNGTAEMNKYLSGLGDVLRYCGIDMNRLSDEQAISGNYGVGKLTKVTDLSGSTAFQYDRFGNNIKKIRTVTGVAGMFATSSEYDALSRETRLTYPDGDSVNSIYTGAVLSSIKYGICNRMRNSSSKHLPCSPRFSRLLQSGLNKKIHARSPGIFQVTDVTQKNAKVAVIASEAKQSCCFVSRRRDCFVAKAPRNDTLRNITK